PQLDPRRMTAPSNTRLLLLNPDPDGTSACLEIDASGHITARRECAPGNPLPPGTGCHDILAVPSEALRLQWLELTAHSSAQAIAAARLALQEHVAATDTDLHVAVAGTVDSDGQRLVAVVGNDRMHEWLQRAMQLG